MFRVEQELLHKFSLKLELTPMFSTVGVMQSLVLSVVLCRPLFVFFVPYDIPLTIHGGPRIICPSTLPIQFQKNLKALRFFFYSHAELINEIVIKTLFINNNLF